MNEYQKKYLDIYYDGKQPRSKVGKEELALLGNLRSDKIRVHFPEFNGINGLIPAHSEEYRITDECNMPEGKINVETLASNLRLWTFRGHKIEYLEA